jgi:hypothetical protein
MIILEILWSGPTILKDSLATTTLHLTELYTVYMAYLQRPEKMCDTCREKMQRKMMGRGFTAL